MPTDAPDPAGTVAGHRDTSRSPPDPAGVVPLVGGVVAVIAVLTMMVIFAGIDVRGPNQYKVSTYAAMGGAFWIAAGVAAAAGAVAIVTATSRDRVGPYVGFSCIYVIYAAILAIPARLNVTLWGRGDPFTHGTQIEAIVAGNVPASAPIYPVSHVLGSLVAFATGSDTEDVLLVVPWLVALMQPIVLVLVAQAVGASRQVATMVGGMGMTFATGWFTNFTPNHLSNLFVVYLVLLLAMMTHGRARGSMRATALLFLFALALPPFHPVTAIGAFSLVAGISLYYSMQATIRRRMSHWNHAMFLGVWLLAWISGFYAARRTVARLFDLFEGSGQNVVEGVGRAQVQAEDLGFNPAVLIVKTLAPPMAVCILALVGLVLLWRRRELVSRPIFAGLAYGGAIVFVFMAVFFFLNLPFSPLRLLVYLVLPALVILVPLFETLFADGQRPTRRVVGAGAAFTILAVVGVLGTLAVHPSPYLLDPSEHMLAAEVDGVRWVAGFTHDEAALAITARHPLDRIGDVDAERVPFHFEYDRLAQGECYVQVLNQLDRIFYVDVLPSLAEQRYSEADFGALDGIPSASRIFDSGGLDVWRVCT